MIITIERKRREYNFLLDNKLIYKGKRNIFSKRTLYDVNDFVIATIKHKTPFFSRTYYKVRLFEKNRDFNFKLIKKNNPLYKGSFITKIAEDNYEVINHFNGLQSYFCNGIQIGYVKINGVDFLYNENKVLICNSDLDLNIICSLVFALECKFENPTDIRLNIIFAEKQVFDANWQPT